jgi:hypothetical protein
LRELAVQLADLWGVRRREDVFSTESGRAAFHANIRLHELTIAHCRRERETFAWRRRYEKLASPEHMQAQGWCVQFSFGVPSARASQREHPGDGSVADCRAPVNVLSATQQRLPGATFADPWL